MLVSTLLYLTARKLCQVGFELLTNDRIDGHQAKNTGLANTAFCVVIALQTNMGINDEWQLCTHANMDHMNMYSCTKKTLLSRTIIQWNYERNENAWNKPEGRKLLHVQEERATAILLSLFMSTFTTQFNQLVHGYLLNLTLMYEVCCWWLKLGPDVTSNIAWNFQPERAREIKLYII